MSEIEQRISRNLQQLAEVLNDRNWKFACAESCTGGWLAKSCTDLAGSSNWFDCGFVTYSNHAKTRMLGVQNEIIQRHGAVSEAVAMEMAEGVLLNSQARVAVSISGIAGPGGGSADKPVGTVCFGFSIREQGGGALTCHFDGDRSRVRLQSVDYAIAKILQMLI